MFQPPSSLTVLNAKSVLGDGFRAIDAGQTTIDLRHVVAVDSAAVAVLLAWQRAAQARGQLLNFGALPANLQSLTELYGVAPLLQASKLDAMPG